MKNIFWLTPLVALCLSIGFSAQAQETASEKSVEQKVKEVEEKVKDIAEQVDSNEQAHEVSAGILSPIYAIAEYLAFPSFHWTAFALMVAGVVSFALQLVFAKLVVLTKLGLSIKEILSDVFGLLISLVGLVLTTQAAAENSNFTQMPAAVISATAAGVIVGFVFYRWGQAQEVQALAGRKKRAS